ncbi:MAG: single-stranded DNA-specific exonuclease [halophilic archaeon J07HX64]|jgi:Single-stranded DNA-specific exonuclease|nr:MAG: single-stranded DNA-specific exonuclease [halophilic archaeon J07HX64]
MRSGPVPELAETARSCAARLCEAESVLLASHIDADGLTSAAIGSAALERAGIPHEVVFKKQLDDTEIASIAARPQGTVLFTDFGSGQLDTIAEHEAAGEFEPVIADHHQPADATTDFHMNPLLVGLDGASELSGAGTTYVLARALAAVDDRTARPSGVADNRDLAALAVVGAVGDMQATDEDGLVGANEGIVEEGIEAGVLDERTDLALYGKQTRPLPKLLEYASEVRIPGVSNDPQGAVSFLQELDIDARAGDSWRRWVDLSDDERQTAVSALMQRALRRGVPAAKTEQLVGTTYILTEEGEGTELRDASEFSTLLNATARYERADVGLAVCLGDRDGALDRAQRLLANHRRNLSEGLDTVKQQGVEQADNLQWFDAGTEIRETIVGIVAGMALGVDGVDPDCPILAFAQKQDESGGEADNGSDSEGGDEGVGAGDRSAGRPGARPVCGRRRGRPRGRWRRRRSRHRSRCDHPDRRETDVRGNRRRARRGTAR